MCYDNKRQTGRPRFISTSFQNPNAIALSTNTRVLEIPPIQYTLVFSPAVFRRSNPVTWIASLFHGTSSHQSAGTSASPRRRKRRRVVWRSGRDFPMKEFRCSDTSAITGGEPGLVERTVFQSS
jgi:hypothetical protein